MIISRLMRSLAIIVSSVFAANQVHADGPNFARDVRPILSDHCFACHGPDEHERQADLRLDAAEGISTVVDGWESGACDLEERILTNDSASVMPPPEFGKPLSGEQKELLLRWVREGAPFANHWAFEAPTKQVIPDESQAIDFFIERAIEREGLNVNPTASNAALLRRVCLTVTGLPPTRDQIARAKSSTFSYEAFVDELLASPAFGQHLGRHWLDLVRYADTHGLHLDNYREMWPYRDWVIDAFNQNMPFDRFVTEQLAGDLLPHSTLAQKIASGYNRLNVTTNEGGSIYDEVFARNVMDRTDAFGTVFLGLTTQCATCHDHKFDPITQKDYYSLYAFFNSLDGRAMDGNVKNPPPVARVTSEAQVRELAELDAQIAALKAELSGPIDSVDAAQRAWEENYAASVGAEPSSDSTIRLSPVHLAGPFPVESSDQAYSRKYASQQSAFDAAQSFVFEERDFGWERIDLEPVQVHELGLDGDATSVNVIHQSLTSPSKLEIKMLLGTSDGHQVFLNGKRVAQSHRRGPLTPLAHKYSLSLKKGLNDLYIKTVSEKTPKLTFAYQSENISPPPGLATLLGQKPESRTSAQQKAVEVYYREVVCDHPDWTSLQDLLSGTQEMRKKLEESIPTTLIWKETPTPREAKVLIRGQYDQPGEAVTRRTPVFLRRFQRELRPIDWDWLGGWSRKDIR